MRNIWRLSIVFVIGGVAFYVAITKLNNPPFSACQQVPPSDPAYSAVLAQDPTIDLTRYDLRISHDSAPVTGAKVCMQADMGGIGGMSGMGLNQVATEVGPGIYQLPLRFPMGGAWRGRVVIAPRNQGTVGVPLQFDVKSQ